jgi:hypothetical protein
LQAEKVCDVIFEALGVTDRVVKTPEFSPRTILEGRVVDSPTGTHPTAQ